MARRPGPSTVHVGKVTDRVREAWISGTSSRHAGWEMPAGDQLANALTEIQEAATDHKGQLRTDLLGQLAGLHKGLALGRPDYPRSPHDAVVAELLVAAGADASVMAEWVSKGIERARPRLPPNSG